MSADDFKKEKLRIEKSRENIRFRRRTGREDTREEEERDAGIESRPGGSSPEPDKSEKELIEIFKEKLQKIEGTKSAIVLDNNLDVVKKASSAEIAYALRRTRARVYAVILDGLATNTMVRMAEEAGCKYFVAKNFAVSQETSVNLLSL